MELFPQRNPIETAEIYGMVGGVPLYLMQFQNGGTLRGLTEAALLDPNSILYEDEHLARQGVSKASRYNAVIDAIANGRTQSGEIAAAIGPTTAETSYYLKELEHVAWLRRQPLGGKGKGRSTDSASSVSGFDSSHRILPRSSIGMPGRAWRSIEKGTFRIHGTGFSKISATSGFGARWQETSRP